MRNIVEERLTEGEKKNIIWGENEEILPYIDLHYYFKNLSGKNALKMFTKHCYDIYNNNHVDNFKINLFTGLFAEISLAKAAESIFGAENVQIPQEQTKTYDIIICGKKIEVKKLTQKNTVNINILKLRQYAEAAEKGAYAIATVYNNYLYILPAETIIFLNANANRLRQKCTQKHNPNKNNGGGDYVTVMLSDFKRAAIDIFKEGNAA